MNEQGSHKLASTTCSVDPQNHFARLLGSRYAKLRKTRELMQGCAWAYRIRHLIGDEEAASVAKLIEQRHLQKSDYLSKGERLNL